MDILLLALPAGLAVIALLVAGFVMVRLYKKTKADEALVRTGLGGPKVILGGGGIILPGLHEVMPVSLKTMSITINGGEGLITNDSRRVDVEALFSMRVAPNAEAIMMAAQSLGANTNNISAIRTLLDGKVQDVMRAIAASMKLMDLHLSRADFQKRVHEALNKELQPNGLELENVSITKLDETPISRLDENNSFDIAGLSARATVIAAQRQERVKTEEAEKLVIAGTQKENRVALLAIQREEETATQKQRLELADLAGNTARRETEINEQTELERQRIVIDRQLKVAEAEILTKQKVDEAEVTARAALEVSRQQRAAEVAASSEMQYRAEANAANARAEAIEAEEKVTTAKVLAIAEREKQVAVLSAEQDAEQRATSIRVQARVEREAAEDQAAAIIARAEAKAQAEKIDADALLERGKAEAAVIAARVEAENQISADIMAHKERMAKIEALPGIISAMVEPARHIESFRVHQISGLNGLTGGGSEGEGARSEGVVDQLFNGMRANAVAMPLLKEIGGQIGINFDGSISDMAGTMIEDAAPALAPVAVTVTGAEEATSEAKAPRKSAPKGTLKA